jgi:hypothetical protein
LTKYVAPALGEKAFTCPVCGVLAQQHWVSCNEQGGTSTPIHRCFCTNCHKKSYWEDRGRAMILPRMANAPMPHPDLPKDCVADYLEARNVADDSPRAAAALLRLCVQRLLSELGGKGKSIDDDIATLVSKGLPPQVKDALDICRVVGNNAVHPGELVVNDDPALVAELFVLINFIVAQTIEREKSIAAMMAKLPQGAKDAIAKRDARAIAAATATAAPVPPVAP